MEVYLIRHADAGTRTFGPHDRYRQLSDKGFHQAKALVDFFTDRVIGDVYSSPATRCVQTVEPVAAAAGITVIENTALWEDVGLDDVFDLIESAASTPNHPTGGLVMCSHGNLIPAVVERLVDRGADVHGRGCERASIWMLRSVDGRWIDARYYTPRTGYAG